MEMLMPGTAGFPPLLPAAIAEELASHGYVVVGVNHTYETAVTVFADGQVVPMSPAAVAGVLGPQSGPYQERFAQRAAVCDYKAADLASVADQLQQLPPMRPGCWPAGWIWTGWVGWGIPLAATPLLEGPSGDYPEVAFGSL
jgi:hypothetical protein